MSRFLKFFLPLDMFVPFLSSRGESPRRSFAIWPLSLERRKGGGGGGKGGGGHSSSHSSSSSSSGKTSSHSSSSSSSSGKTSSSSSSSISKYKTTTQSKTWTKSVGVASTIPPGHLFAGRVAGGGVRGEIYGTKTYGSGYPGISGRGTSGRGFPFFFWPLSWPLAAGVGAGAGLYLNNHDEYGTTSNTSRPGGRMTYAIFSSSPLTPNTTSTFRFLADNSTVRLMNNQVEAACGALMGTNTTGLPPIPFSDTETAPSPEQAVQYFRASSAVLTLDGYNNTATLAVEGSPDTSLPANTNYELLSCLNSTIGPNLPLIDGAPSLQTLPNINLAGLIGMVWLLLCTL